MSVILAKSNPLYITPLNSYPNKDTNLNTKKQSCNASNGPK